MKGSQKNSIVPLYLRYAKNVSIRFSIRSNKYLRRHVSLCYLGLIAGVVLLSVSFWQMKSIAPAIQIQEDQNFCISLTSSDQLVTPPLTLMNPIGSFDSNWDSNYKCIQSGTNAFFFCANIAEGSHDLRGPPERKWQFEESFWSTEGLYTCLQSTDTNYATLASCINQGDDSASGFPVHRRNLQKSALQLGIALFLVSLFALLLYRTLRWALLRYAKQQAQEKIPLQDQIELYLKKGDLESALDVILLHLEDEKREIRAEILLYHSQMAFLTNSLRSGQIDFEFFFVRRNLITLRAIEIAGLGG